MTTKSAMLNQIREEAFRDEIQKLADLSEVNKRFMSSGIHTPSPGTYRMVTGGPKPRWTQTKSAIGPIRKFISGAVSAVGKVR